MLDLAETNPQPKKPRNPNLRPFQPGNNANPGGRPKIPDDVKAMARAATADAIQCLVRIVRNPKAPPSAQVSAADSLLNRAWGRPEQAVSVSADMTGSLVDVLASLAAIPIATATVIDNMEAEDERSAQQLLQDAIAEDKRNQG
jgi:hypothetical protein